MKHHRRVLLLLSSSLSAALWMTASTARAQGTTPTYGVTDLGSLGTPVSVALAVADGGLPSVAGYATTGSGDIHAFVGNPVAIRDLGTLGGSRSEARATQFGWAAGVSQLTDGNNHAFLYRGYGSMIDLGTLGGSASYANGMATGTTILIVGVSYTAGDVALRPFLCDGSTGVLTELPVSLGGVNATATAVNTRGHVVGYADLPGGVERHAYLYANGVTQDLGSFGAGSEADAINGSDVVVGRAWGFGGAPNHAFRYEAGALRDLGTFGGASSEATDVADDGTIVGWADDPQGARRAFIWRDGIMTDLNTLIPSQSGWILVAATAINDHGGIVGFGYHQSQPHAFMLTPPIDLRADLRVHDNLLDTNFPNPHEAGQPLTMGVTVYQNAPTVFAATGVTIVDTLTGPVEIESWYGDGMPACAQSGLQLTCRVKPVEFSRDLMIGVRATGPGAITHSAIVTADQPDPNPANNSASQSNVAVSLASLTITQPTLVGGQYSLARATLTSPTPGGGATVHLTSSNPGVASVPAQFDVLPGCCDGGIWREFYVRTTPVALPVTVDISASYGLVTRTVPITVVPAGTPFPYGGTTRPIPGTIQAEDYDIGGRDVAYHDLDSGNNGGAYRADDVDLEPTANGGANVGWTGAGEWLAYTVNVASTGAYTLDARVASLGSAGAFHIEFDGVDRTGPIAVPDTGGWQVWTTLTRPVSLDAGTHLMRVRFDANGPNGTVGNLDYLRFTPRTVGPAPHGGTPAVIPGTVEAEDFDEGGEGIAYHDRSPENSGGEYRATGVDIQSTVDPLGGRYNVGWIEAGEWLAYTVEVAATGDYLLDARVASPGPGGTYHISFDGVDRTGPIVLPDTGGWQAWATTRVVASLDAGVHLLRVSFDTNGVSGAVGNLNYLRFTPVATPTPFRGTRREIPGRIEAEEFNDGGQGVAYFDATPGNDGGAFRATDVDLQAASDTGGGYNVGWISAREWLDYTVSIAQDGTYTMTARVAAQGPGGTFHVEVDGVDLTGPLTIPDTGSWQAWTDVSAPLSLTGGRHALRFVADANGPTGVFGNLNYLDVLK